MVKRVLFFMLLCFGFLYIGGRCEAVTIEANDDFVDLDTGKLKQFDCVYDGLSYRYNPDGNISTIGTSGETIDVNWGKLVVGNEGINKTKLTFPDRIEFDVTLNNGEKKHYSIKVDSVLIGVTESSSLKEVTIPPDVRYDIGSSRYGKPLEKIIFAEGRTTIGELEPVAKFRKKGVVIFPSDVTKEVVLPQTLKRIEDNAFFQWTDLEKINFPSGLEYIGARAFFHTNLKKANIAYAKTIGDEAFAWSAIESVNLPTGIQSFGNQVFDVCDKLKRVSIPSDWETIPKNAFSYCTSLNTVDIPQGVKYIDEGAFSGCFRIKNITLPNSLLEIGKSAFYSLGISEIEIPNGVRKIDEGAFYDCVKLKSVTIPNSVNYIGKYAFCGSTHMLDVYIPANVSYIGEEAFGYDDTGAGTNNIDSGKTVSLLSARKTKRIKGFKIYGRKNTKAQKYAKKNKFKFISDLRLKKTFEKKGLKYSVTKYNTVRIVKLNNKTAKKISIPSTVTFKSRKYKVTGISKQAFKGTNITSLVIGNNVSAIGRQAFFKCKKLKRIKIKSVKLRQGKIGENAFKGIPSNAKVTVPSSCKVLYDTILRQKGLTWGAKLASQ